MKKRLRVQDLMLEITRECNLTCAHCLRGNAEKATMAPKIIEAVLAGIAEIGTLSFTGGEPALHPEVIKRVLTNVQMLRMPVSSVYAATNGTVESVEFAVAFMEWYAYCYKYGQGEGFSLRISNSEFHLAQSKPRTQLYNAFTFTYVDPDSKQYGKPRLVRDGRAKHIPDDGKYAFGKVENRVEDIECEDHGACVEISDAVLYINVYGDVMFGCDYSYQRQKREKIGNVLDRPLNRIVIDYLKREGKL